jgi:hypothetical protein
LLLLPLLIEQAGLGVLKIVEVIGRGESLVAGRLEKEEETQSKGFSKCLREGYSFNEQHSHRLLERGFWTYYHGRLVDL